MRHPYGRVILVPFKNCLFQFKLYMFFFSLDIFDFFFKALAESSLRMQVFLRASNSVKIIGSGTMVYSYNYFIFDLFFFKSLWVIKKLVHWHFFDRRRYVRCVVTRNSSFVKNIYVNTNFCT